MSYIPVWSIVPDIYQKNIETINYKKLKDRGIKCLLFDLDNTLVPYHVKQPTKKLRDFFKTLKKQGFKIIWYFKLFLVC